MTALAAASTDTLAAGGTGQQVAGHPIRRAFRHHPLAVVAAGYLCVLVGAAIAAGLSSDAPEDQDLGHVLAGPSGQHWLGTDRLGRDVFTRLLFGARVTLLDVLLATAIFLAIGVPLGLAAGYRRGWLDGIVVRLADLVLAVPAIVVLLMVVAVFPGSDIATMVALGILGSPGLLRIVRGTTMAVRGELYVQAARLSGLGSAAILRRHVLPRIAGPVIIQTSLFAATALLAESGLSFLGLTRPETRGPSWGNMVAEASNVISQDPWLLAPTGGALMITVIAFGLIGDAVRDVTTGRSLAAVPLIQRRRRSPRASTAQPQRGDALLSITGLTASIGDTQVLRDITLEVGAGEAVGIVGESGCGKTLTAKAVLGLLPAGGRIDAGNVVFDGRDLTGLTDKQLNAVRGSEIALISQDPANSLDPTFTVGSQLREVIRRHRRQSRRAADQEARRLLSLVRLPDPDDVLRKRPAELSGGMAQRVCIAMALAAEPKLLIADEPTTALDVTVQAEILTLLRDLQHRLGMAILLVTHDWGVLADMCQRAVVIYAGEVVESAAVDELYNGPRHPYTAALLASNPHRAQPGRPLPAISGSVPAPGRWPQGCHFASRCMLAEPRCTAGVVPVVSPSALHLARCLRTDEMAAS